MAAIRYEVWTRQESGSFVRKFPLRGEISASFATDLFGRAILVLPVNHPRLDDILVIDQSNRANDAASIIRAYIGTTPIFDFYVESLELNFTDTGLRTATAVGSSRGTCFDRVRVRQYDWNVKPSVDPDWEYGVGGSNGLLNAGFEDWNLNGDAETGEIAPWTDTPDDSIFDAPDVSLIVQSTDVFAGTYAFEIDPGVLHSGMQTATIPVNGGGQYVFSARLKDPNVNGDRYTMYIKMGSGSTLDVGASVWSGYGIAELDGAAYRAGVSDGTWQTLDATVTFGPDVTETTLIIIYDDHIGGSSGLFRVDNITVSGPGIGLDPWEAIGTWDTFELDTATVHTGTNSLKFKVGAASTINSSGVRQHITDLVVGKTYTYGAWFQHDGVGNEPIVMVAKRPSGGWIASNVTQIPTGALWTFAYVTFLADTTEIWLDWRYGAAGASPNISMDDTTFTNSLPAATVGKILNDLLDDAAIDHAADNRTALAWLTRTFTDTHDSSGAAWDQDIDIRLRRGGTYRWMIETMERMGYEFSIDVNPADETDWRFNAYNSGNMGTDHSVGDGPAILSRPGLMAAGPFLRREPVASYTMAEGDNFYWDEYRDTAIETNWGEIETYIGSQDSLSGVLLKQATEVVTSDGGESLILSFAGHPLTAGIDYDVGDTIRVTLGDDYYPSATFRVAAISVSDDEVEPQFQVEFQPV